MNAVFVGNGDGNGKDDGTDQKPARAGSAGPAENHPSDPAEHHKISAGTGNRPAGMSFHLGATNGREDSLSLYPAR